MCRVFYIRGKNPEIVKVVTLYSINESYRTGNEDGYFFVTNTLNSIRTLDFVEYVNEVKRAQFNEIFCHLRLATSEVNEKGIHGWKFKLLNDVYFTAHNGVLGEPKKGYPDTYWFFKFLEGSKTAEELTERVEEYAEIHYGYGVFMAVSKFFEKLLLINIRTDSYCYELEIEYKGQKDKVILLTSKRDIVPENGSNEFTIYSYEEKTEEKIENGKKRTIIYKVLKDRLYSDSFKVTNKKYIKLKENKLWLIDLSNETKEYEKELEINGYYLKGGYGGYYYKYY